MTDKISREVIDLPVPEMFASADEKVISWKGENYYRACGAFVRNLPGGGASSCIKPEVHEPSTGHEDMDGNRVRSDVLRFGSAPGGLNPDLKPCSEHEVHDPTCPLCRLQDPSE